MTKHDMTNLTRMALISTYCLSISGLTFSDIQAEYKSPTKIKGRMLEEVLVTARRASENLQDVPVAISALSTEDLDRNGISTGRELQGRIPSLVMGTGSLFRNTISPTIRGQGASFNASAGVVQYFAEVALPADSFTVGQGGPGMLFDLQNVQILKGPQGTLFGRNTTGGAMVLDPAPPENEFKGYFRAESGNYNHKVYEGVVNIPIIDDRLLARISAKTEEREGFTYDIKNNKDYDNINYWTSRFALTWIITENAENTLFAYKTKRAENGPGTVIDAINSEGINETIMSAFLGVDPLPLVPVQLQPGCLYVNIYANSTNCGQDIVAEQQSRDKRHVDLSADTADRLETAAVINSFNLQLNEAMTFRSISSLAIYQRHFGWDQDGSRAALNDIRPEAPYSSDTETVSQELQLQGSTLDGWLNYVTGIYYESRKPKSTQQTFTTALFQEVIQEYRIETTSYGPYAQLTYNFGHANNDLDGLNLTAGVRRTTDDQKGYAFLTFLGNGEPMEGSEKASAYTWLLSLDYRMDDTLLYGKVSRGYKSGGFSGTVANPDNFYFAPEYVISIEAGTKSDFEIGSMPMRLNLAAYNTDYTDMHKSVAETYIPPDALPGSLPRFGAATLNVGESWVRGAELELTAKPTDSLTINATYTYTDAEYVDFAVPVGATTAQLDCTGERISGGDIGDFSCIPFSEILKNQYSISTTYLLPIPASWGDLEATLSYNWQDERYTGTITLPEAEPGAMIEPLGLWSGSVNWYSVLGSPINLQIYGSNLANEKYRLSNSNVWSQLFFRSTLWGEPRMFGARLSYHFGE